MYNFINFQIQQLNNNGIKILPLKIKKLLLIFFCYFLSLFYLPIFFLIVIVRKKKFIRFCAIPTARIGHLGFETDILLSNNKLDKNNKNYLNIFTQSIYDTSTEISNKFLLKLFKRKIVFLPTLIVQPFIILATHFKFFEQHVIKLGEIKKLPNLIIQTDPIRDINNSIQKTSPNISFTEKEEKKGWDFLEKVFKGNKNNKFITLIVRDDEYLKKKFVNQNLSYHKYRNCNIENYIEACEKLTELGYYIFRMGSVSDNKILSKNSKIIDYASNGMRTEFLDIFLAAKSEFTISSGTGWDAVPYIFRKPILFVSYAPLAQMHTFSNKFMTSFKNHYSNKLKRNLRLSEIFELNLANAQDSVNYENKNIELIENTKLELVDIFLEMENFVKNKLYNKPMKCNYNYEFFKIFKKYTNYKNELKILHGEYNARISSKFLENNQNFTQ